MTDDTLRAALDDIGLVLGPLCEQEHGKKMRPHYHAELPADRVEHVVAHRCPACGDVHLPPTDAEVLAALAASATDEGETIDQRANRMQRDRQAKVIAKRRPAAAPALDVERLLRAQEAAGLRGSAWPRGIAERVAREYAALQEPSDD